MIRPNRIKPVDAIAEKYNFFLDSFFLLIFILLSKIFMLVLFACALGVLLSKYLEIILSVIFKDEFFIGLFNHWIVAFANSFIKKDKPQLFPNL